MKRTGDDICQKKEKEKNQEKKNPATTTKPGVILGNSIISGSLTTSPSFRCNLAAGLGSGFPLIRDHCSARRLLPLSATRGFCHCPVRALCAGGTFLALSCCRFAWREKLTPLSTTPLKERIKRSINKRKAGVTLLLSVVADVWTHVKRPNPNT